MNYTIMYPVQYEGGRQQLVIQHFGPLSKEAAKEIVRTFRKAKGSLEVYLFEGNVQPILVE